MDHFNTANIFYIHKKILYLVSYSSIRFFSPSICLYTSFHACPHNFFSALNFIHLSKCQNVY